MKISEILINSLRYPLDNVEKFKFVMLFCGLLAIGTIIFLFGNELDYMLASRTLFTYAGVYYGICTVIALIISGILSLAWYLVFPGYLVSVVKAGIDQSVEIPSFDLGGNIIRTLKLWVISFVYYIIPAIFSTIFLAAVIFGTKINLGNVLYDLENYRYLTFAPGDGLFITVIFFCMFVFLVFIILYAIAMARFAKYDSLSEALSIGKVWADLKQIGIIKTFLVLFAVAILSKYIFYMMYISYDVYTVFAYIFQLVVLVPFITLFASYAIGLLYSEVE